MNTDCVNWEDHDPFDENFSAFLDLLLCELCRSREWCVQLDGCQMCNSCVVALVVCNAYDETLTNL